MMIFFKAGHRDSELLAATIANNPRLRELYGDIQIEPGTHNVLKGFNGSAVLIEAGFMSTVTELEMIKNNTSDIGFSIAGGIGSFIQDGGGLGLLGIEEKLLED